MESRLDFDQRDRDDDLRTMRERFELPPSVLYLDGNSLGALPLQVRSRMRQVVEEEWGRGLIGSWNGADWISLPRRVGDKIARLVGARPGEVVAADSTTVNLYKALSVAARIDPRRRVVVSERANFPTDLYVAGGVVSRLGEGSELLLCDASEGAIEAALAQRGAQVAAVLLTHVHYTTARIYDMARITAAAHAAGAVTVWDLSHSAGIMPVDLEGCGVDFAVGCGYKHLNGGPGAPAFLYAAQRFHDRVQPIPGWMGDARPFEFREDHQPAAGIARYLSGTPAVLGLSALEASVDLLLEVPMASIRRKSVALCDAFMALVENRCAGLGLELVGSRDAAARGSHVSYRHPASYAVMQALFARGVIGDCRPPDLMRFGFAPLYLRFVDVWDAVAVIEDVLRSKAWERPEYRMRRQVT